MEEGLVIWHDKIRSGGTNLRGGGRGEAGKGWGMGVHYKRRFLSISETRGVIEGGGLKGGKIVQMSSRKLPVTSSRAKLKTKDGYWIIPMKTITIIKHDDNLLPSSELQNC